MSPIKKPAKHNSRPSSLWIVLATPFLVQCKISQEWGPSAISYQIPSNHTPSQPASFHPVTNPVNAQSFAHTSVPAATGSTQPFSHPRFPVPRQVAPIPAPRPQAPVLVRPQTVFRPAPTAPVNAPVRVTPNFSPPAPQFVKHVKPAPQPVVQSAPRLPQAPPPSFSRPQKRGSVKLVNGLAVAPPDAPDVVKRAVAAGNRLQNKPYKWGGGHAKLNDSGYDCSGAVSYVLREAGLLKGQMTSQGFFNYGQQGKGEWITVWAKKGHVFIIVGDLRLDTGGSSTRTGPRWKTKSRSYKNCVARHPAGL